MREKLKRWTTAERLALPSILSPAITYSRPGFPTINGIAGLDHFYREVRQVRKGVTPDPGRAGCGTRPIQCGRGRPAPGGAA